MFVERRNQRERAHTLCRVVAWLCDASLGGRRPISAIPDDPVPRHVAERILRRLMFRGLTRKLAGEWVPGPPLLRPAQLRRIGDNPAPPDLWGTESDRAKQYCFKVS
jgi:hypothetical protein